MLRPLEVIVVPAGFITDHPKMMACCCAELGLFYAINTRDKLRPCIPIRKTPLHEFLQHDSFLQCGDPLEIDDYMVEQALQSRGVVGRLDASVVPEIKKFLANALYLSERDKSEIVAFLDRY
jgi:hypothetical protein